MRVHRERLNEVGVDGEGKGGGGGKGKNMGRVMKRASAGGEAERNTVIVHGAGTVRPLSGIVSRMSRLCSFFAGQYVGAVLSPFGFVFGHGRAVVFADLLVVSLRCCCCCLWLLLLFFFFSCQCVIHSCHFQFINFT